MSKLSWDAEGHKEFNYGVSQGVLYKYNTTQQKWLGEAWNGLTNVTDSPEGGDVEKKYADNILYASVRGVEDYNGSLEAYSFPDGWRGCIGQREVATGIRVGQQDRDRFCFSWRTEKGNDQNQSAGYVIHVVYNSTADVGEMSYDTTEESVDFEPMSFDFDSNPVPVTGYKPTSKLTFDSTELGAAKMAILEGILYGGEDTDAWLPLPDALFRLLNGQTPKEEEEENT